MYIYMICHQCKNGGAYIGSTSNLQKRWKEHRNMLLGNYHDNPRLQNAWNKYGSDQFEFLKIETCLDSQRIEREKEWIDNLKLDGIPIYNMIEPGKPPMEGRRHSFMTKEKMSKMRQNISPELRAKLSTSAKAKIFTVEHRENIAIAKLTSKILKMWDNGTLV